MSIISDIKDALKEIPISDILRERLTFLQEIERKLVDDLAGAKAVITAKDKEISDLKANLDEVMNRIGPHDIPGVFKEYLGVLFKRDDSGIFSPVAYCPFCRTPLWNNDPVIFPYECSRCGFQMMIHESLTSIVEKFNKS